MNLKMGINSLKHNYGWLGLEVENETDYQKIKLE